MTIRVPLARSLRSRAPLRLDDSLDGRDALFAVQWGGSISLEVIEFDCWSFYDDVTAAHRRHHQRARRILYLPVTLLTTVVVGAVSGRADLSLVWWSAATMLTIAVVGQLLQNYVAVRSRRRWERNPLLSCIDALGGFTALPVIWGRNIPAAVRLSGARDQGVKAAELASAYRCWVGELAGAHVDEALAMIEALSDEYHGSLGDLRVTASGLV